MSEKTQNPAPPENEEIIDVSEIVARIEALEKAADEIKKEFEKIGARQGDLEESFDALVEKIRAGG